MVRIAPDSNDIIVWPLTEQTGAYRNVGTQSPNSSTTDLTMGTYYGYAVTTGATYVSGSTDIGNHGDEVMTSVSLPFNFTFFGTTYSSVFVSSNGFLEFGQSTQAFGFSLPNASLGATICAFEFDERTDPSPTYGIFTSTTGSTPSRIFTIEWRNRPFSGTGDLFYEVRLFEGSNVFEIIYGPSTSASTGVIGVQAAAGTTPTVYSNSTVAPASGTKITFTPDVSYALVRNGNGVFDNCAFIPGTGNFPVGSSSTRNYAQGAKTIQPAYPITLSAWVYIRSYNSSNFGTLIGKQYRDPAITTSWSNPFYSAEISMSTATSGLSWYCAVANSTTTRIIIQIDDFPIPQAQWSHIGMTYDGASIKAFLNGVQCIYYSAGTQFNSVAGTGAISYTDGVNGSGPWKIGAITATGSGNKEEANYMIQDIRIASVARPLSYFQDIYKAGIQTIVPTVQFFYKLRAFDLGCPTPTPVVWTDTQVSLANAPTPPCGGPYSTVEVIGTWTKSIAT